LRDGASGSIVEEAGMILAHGERRDAMTEEEWLACTDPAAMLKFLRGRASDRKLRLFGCGCCRLVWHRHSEVSRRAVEVSERFADGEASLSDLRTAHKAVEYQGKSWYYSHPASVASSETPEWAWSYGLPETQETAARTPMQVRREAWPGERAHYLATHGELLREVFGNPLRPVVVDPTWLAWNGGTIPKLAQAIYDDRAFERLPVLADALEEAGCTDAEILAHCRGAGPHVRGCWVVDLLLGKG
jgi:hypothetical protein